MTRLIEILKKRYISLAVLTVALLVAWSCTEDITFDSFDVDPIVNFYSPADGGSMNPKDAISVAFHDDVALASGTVTFTDENGVELWSVTEELSTKDDTIVVANTGRYDTLGHIITAVALDAVGNTITANASVTVSDVPPTVGIIGTAADGWDEDVNMFHKDDDDPANQYWFLIYDLSQNEAKFRWDDAWDVVWGVDASSTFPTGTGDQDPSAGNIPVDPAGQYWIQLNVDASGNGTGVYDFEEITTIGIIGDGTPTGWGSDTDLVQDSSDPHIWTVNIDLTAAQCKFRANDDWRIAWGSASFPNGVGDYAPGSANMVIDADGNYDVTFNSETGAYTFVKK